MSALFADALNKAGLTQKQFSDIVNKLSGCKPITRQRTSGWAQERSGNNEAAIALANLLSRLPPAELALLLKE